MISILRRQLNILISDERFFEILTGSTWALGARVAATGMAMIFSIIIARFYSAEVLGTVALLYSLLTLVTIFTVLGTNISILRLIPEHLAKYSANSAFQVYRKTQHLVAGVSILTGMLFYFTSSFLAEKVFAKPHLSFYFALVAGFIIFQSLMILNTDAIRGLRLIRVFALMQLLPSFSKLLILLTATVFFFHQDNPIYAMFASIALTALAGAWIMDCTFKKKIGPDDAVHPMPVKEILSLSLPMLMTSAMTFVIGQTGVLILGVLRPEVEVGYYSVAVRLATLTSFVLFAINTIAAPKFSELFHAGKMDELFYVAKKSTKLIFWTTTPILLVLVLFGKSLIGLLFGSDFIVAYGAMVLLVLGQFVNSIAGSTGYFMNMTGGQKIFRNIITAAAGINIALNLLLIPIWGINGAALAGMSSLVFWNVYVLIYIKVKHGRTIGYIPLFNRV